MDKKFVIGAAVRFVKRDKWHDADEMDKYIGQIGEVSYVGPVAINVRFRDERVFVFAGSGLEIVLPVADKFKFNIGDRVRVVKARVEGQHRGFERGMQAYENDKGIFTISGYEYLKGTNGYKLKENGRYSWDERCLRRVRKAINAKPQEHHKAIIEAPVPVIKAPEPPKLSLLEFLRKQTAKEPGVCSYGKEMSDGNFIMHVRDICHARIPQYEGNLEIVKLALDIAGHSSDMKKIGKQEQYHRYVNYILNYSPWSPIFHKKGLENALKYGILVNVDKPMYQCQAAAIVLREGSEHSRKLDLFCLLLDKGYSGNTAYLLSSSVTEELDEFKFNGLSNQHRVLSGEQDAKTLFEFFRNGYSLPVFEPYRVCHKLSLGVYKFIAPSAVVAKQINTVLQKGVGVTPGNGWDVDYKVTNQALFTYADSLEKLLNN